MKKFGKIILKILIFIYTLSFMTVYTYADNTSLGTESPSLKIVDYAIEGDQSAGNSFKLKLKIQNTNSFYDAEDIVMKVNVPIDFEIEGTNWIKLDTIKSDEVIEYTLPIKLKDTIKSGYYDMKFDFEYKYSFFMRKLSGSSTCNLSIRANGNNSLEENKKIPYIKVRSYKVPQSLQPGQNFTLQIALENTSNNCDADNVVLDLSKLPEGLIYKDSPSIYIDKIAAGNTYEAEINLSVKEAAKNSIQTLSIPISYKYTIKNITSDGVSNSIIPISVTINTGVTPQIKVSDYSYGSSVLRGNNFQVKLNLTNTSNTVSIENASMTVSLPEGITVKGSNTLLIPKIAPGETIEKVLDAISAQNVKSGYQVLTAEFKYQYSIDGEVKDGTNSEKLSIAVTDNGENGNGGAVSPYILVNKMVVPEIAMAGESIPVKIAFFNTSTSFTAESIKMKITLPEDFTLLDSSSVVFINKLEPLQTVEKTINIKIKPSAKVQTSQIGLDFAFEFFRDGSLINGAAAATIPVSVSQADRFGIAEVQVPDNPIVGEEQMVTVTLINKGRSEAYNISVEITGKISNPGQKQFKGNVEAGKQVIADFSIVGLDAGKTEGEIKVSYEDINGALKEIKYPYVVNFIENAPKQEMSGGAVTMLEKNNSVTESTKSSMVTRVILIIAGVALLIIIFLIVKKKKAKRSVIIDEDI